MKKVRAPYDCIYSLTLQAGVLKCMPIQRGAFLPTLLFLLVGLKNLTILAETPN